MNLTQPLSGRLLVRQLRDGAAIVGAMRFGPDFVPVEGALYAACWVDGAIRVGDQALQGPVEGHERYASAVSWLTQPLWCRSTDPRQFTVRFIESCLDTNQWTAVGLSSGDLGLAGDAAGHAWFDVAGGTTAPITPPADARGHALCGLFAMPIWPLQGQLCTTPQLPRWQRPYFVRYHALLAQVGRGERTIEKAKAEIRRDPEFFNLHGGSIDIDYCRFLAAQPGPSTLDSFGPVTAERVAQDEARAETIVAKILAERRLGELQSMAVALAT